MFRNRLYYSLKPHVPWSLRMGVRRWFARRQRERVRNIWPILPGSERRPANWPGWPEGKQFAFVLSHDIEGAAGVQKVKPLAELEMRLGFRSSFNFTPEGDYAVPAELRDWLVGHGFEVGVHDLKHDGKLFRSHAEFQDHAAGINRYLKDWGAVGFRSGFMLRNLDWIHDLNVQYDASTFDTDPFEPQPDGAGTIFPFWIPNPTLGSNQNHKHKYAPTSTATGSSAVGDPPLSAVRLPGYVELPYTLPQDSTLFLLLREISPAVWINKLDWIARHGGMALLNVHPDYLQIAGMPPSAHTYPVEHYAQLLQHVQSCYAGRFWSVLPRQLVQVVRPSSPPPL